MNAQVNDDTQMSMNTLSMSNKIDESVYGNLCKNNLVSIVDSLIDERRRQDERNNDMGNVDNYIDYLNGISGFLAMIFFNTVGHITDASIKRDLLKISAEMYKDKIEILLDNTEDLL